MGACGSTSAETQDVMAAERQVRRSLEAAKADDAKKIKLLILGAGESGKSTLFKQMKVLYGAPFTPEEAEYMRDVINENILETMQELLSNVTNFLDVDVANKEWKEQALAATADEGLQGEFGGVIKGLWHDDAVQQMWDLRSRLQIVESVQYFFERLDDITVDDYLPTTQDILHARVRTHGIVTEKYAIQGKTFEMYDVGGQRNERRKWVNCFDNVTAVLFVVAISEYDQKMYEDETTNRMVDAIDLFDEVCVNRAFDKSSLILFLNKRDLFEQKIKKFSIKDQAAFRDYAGKPHSYEDGCAYFLRKFITLNRDPERQIYSHVTCATDTSNFKAVFLSCRDTILRNMVKESGFL
ncbi:hypothetical protein CTAYLR_005137 [Chrysophaeum taylorii]|uniref:Uncharacterized protein n=1 Tax=Chrysophaeum taylorii TaxID=2483200 RepID=A0AAD7UDY2_9STRA|nr:hypothetical protein CTAYLR_005137 [Chrysophaeum taylorii]